jgi:hypothetical protein
MNPVRRFIASKRKSRYFQPQKLGNKPKEKLLLMA